MRTPLNACSVTLPKYIILPSLSDSAPKDGKLTDSPCRVDKDGGPNGDTGHTEPDTHTASPVPGGIPGGTIPPREGVQHRLDTFLGRRRRRRRCSSAI